MRSYVIFGSADFHHFAGAPGAAVRVVRPDEGDQSMIGLANSFPMRVHGTDELPVSCSHAQLVGRRLVAQVSAPVAPGTCIRIDNSDALVLGEVLGTWREGSAIFAAIELRHSLPDLAELRSIFDDVRIGKTSNIPNHGEPILSLRGVSL